MVYAPNSDQVNYPCTLVPTITTTPVWTVIITLDRGTPTGISYDEGCFFCASNGKECQRSAFTTTPANTTLANPAADWRPYPDDTYVSCETSFAQCYPSMAALAPGQNYVADNTNHSLPFACVPPSASPTPSPRAPSPSPTNNNASLGLPLVPDAGCDLKVFVVWDGTDSAGNYLKSSNKRFSVYRAFAVATAFQSALNLVQQGFDIANNVKAIAQSVPGMLTPGSNERRLGAAPAPEPAPAPTPAGAPQPELPEVYPGLVAPAGFRSSKHNARG